MASAEQGYPYRYAALLAKLLGAKGEQLTEVSPELIAGIILENDRPEYKFLAGEILAAVFVQVAAVAAQRASAAIVNNLGSGTLVVVEFAEAASGGPGPDDIRVTLDTATSINAALAAATVGTNRDVRARAANPSVAVRSNSTALLLGAIADDVIIPVNITTLLRAAQDDWCFRTTR